MQMNNLISVALQSKTFVMSTPHILNISYAVWPDYEYCLSVGRLASNDNAITVRNLAVATHLYWGAILLTREQCPAQTAMLPN